MASKSAFKMIQNNSDILIEGIIDDLIHEYIYDLKDIEEAQEEYIRKSMSPILFKEVYQKLNQVNQNEQKIIDKYNIKIRKNI